MTEQDATVLVVDDEGLILNLVHSCLRNSRFVPILAADLGIARRICEETERSIEIVLADAGAVAQGSEAFWRSLSARFPAARVVYMSGFPEEQLSLTAWPGQSSFLPKPFRKADLLAALERASSATRSAGGC
jgi:DNA-binding NtrC family response regulator